MTSKPSTTNCPRVIAEEKYLRSKFYERRSGGYPKRIPVADCQPYAIRDDVQKDKGGYSGGVPPLPIPNREVKPARADGTAQAGE